MATLRCPPPDRDSTAIDCRAAEGFVDAEPATDEVLLHGPSGANPDSPWRDWMTVALGLRALVAVLAITVAIFALAGSGPRE